MGYIHRNPIRGCVVPGTWVTAKFYKQDQKDHETSTRWRRRRINLIGMVATHLQMCILHVRACVRVCVCVCVLSALLKRYKVYRFVHKVGCV